MRVPFSRNWINLSREGDVYHERKRAAFERYRNGRFRGNELVLYLDTHPDDRRAMEYFNHYNRIKMQMEREFSQKYFPLNTGLADCSKEWRWGMAPLPWEGECA